MNKTEKRVTINEGFKAEITNTIYSLINIDVLIINLFSRECGVVLL